MHWTTLNPISNKTLEFRLQYSKLLWIEKVSVFMKFIRVYEPVSEKFACNLQVVNKHSQIEIY